jgi:hypothetical protein
MNFVSARHQRFFVQPFAADPGTRKNRRLLLGLRIALPRRFEGDDWFVGVHRWRLEQESLAIRQQRKKLGIVEFGFVVATPGEETWSVFEEQRTALRRTQPGHSSVSERFAKKHHVSRSKFNTEDPRQIVGFG